METTKCSFLVECSIPTVMISASAHIVLFDIVMRVTIAAEFEGLTLSFFKSGEWATDSLMDERTRLFKVTPEFDQELLQRVVGRALDRMPDACALWWRSRRARCLRVNIAWDLCIFFSVMIANISSCQESYHRQCTYQECQPLLTWGTRDAFVSLDDLEAHLFHLI